MLSFFKKFSSSIYGKIFLFIVAIPFVFWGMGDLFSGGNQNSIVKIGKNNVSTKEFIDYVNAYASPDESIDENKIEQFLYDFIGNKLIAEEIENFNIVLSDVSLAKLIKNQDMFKKEKNFSRIEYEKFLLKHSLNAISFEENLSHQEKRKQLLEFIGGGIYPSDFLVNDIFNKMNQKRNIQIIDLEQVYKNKINFSENEIKSYFNKNEDSYVDIFKSIKFAELNLKILTENDEYTDLYFKKIDEIEDLIFQGRNLNFISKKYKLEPVKLLTLNEHGKDKEFKLIDTFPEDLVKNVFKINESSPTVLIESKDMYFIIELTKTEKIKKNFSDQSVKMDILEKLSNIKKRKIISELIAKINSNNFDKNDFDKFSINEDVNIRKIKLNSQKDDKTLKQEMINQIYKHPEKKVIVIADIGLSESFLVYIDKIENVSIKKNSEDFIKYTDLSKKKITNNLFNTYDSYLKKKYEININYQALDGVKSYLQ